MISLIQVTAAHPFHWGWGWLLRGIFRERITRSVSVIGDGAMTGGLAFEALNNTAHLNTKIIVVLNDNGMSISPNIGGLSRHIWADCSEFAEVHLHESSDKEKYF